MAAIKEDLAIKRESLELLQQHHRRIQDIFEVEIVLDFLCDDGITQWLDIVGESSNVKEAKEYIKALCSPSERVDLNYTAELHTLLQDASVHRKLEKQSKAAITFADNESIAITGSDTLSVTLALSSVEELINKYLNQETNSATAQVSPSARLSSQRLDDELRRLSTENKGILLEDDYYSNTNDAVKRTILNWIKDDSVLEEGGGESAQVKLGSVQDKRVGNFSDSSSTVTKPMASLFGTKANPINIGSVEDERVEDFSNSTSTVTKPKRRIFTEGSLFGSKDRPIKILDDVNSPNRKSSKPDIELLPPETFVTTRRVASNTSVSNSSSSGSLLQPKLSLAIGGEDNCDVGLKPWTSELLPESIETGSNLDGNGDGNNGQTSNDKPIFYVQQANSVKSEKEKSLLAIGLQYNFPESVSELVCKEHGTDLSKEEFLRLAMRMKSERDLANYRQSTLQTPSSSLAVCPTMDKNASVEPKSKYSAASIQKRTSPITGEEIQEEDYLLAFGLSQNLSEEKIESIFNSHGTRLTKTEFLNFAKVPVTTKSSFPKAPSTDDLMNSKTLQPEMLKNKQHMQPYWNQLQRDFKEEDHNCGVEELKSRNFERQRLLRKCYENSSKPDDCEQQIIEENWDNGIGFKEVENKKRKHKNGDSGPRKSRFSPDTVQMSPPKVNSGKQGKSGKKAESPKSPSKTKSATATGKNSNWSPTDDKTNFGSLYISQEKRNGYNPNNSHLTEKSRSSSLNFQTSQHSVLSKPYSRDRTTRSPSPRGAAPKHRAFSQSPQNLKNRPSTAATEMMAPSVRKNLRYIVIDGSNVAFHHGNHLVFSCKGIEIVVNYFLKRGHTEITAFVPQWRTRTVQSTPIEDQHLLEELRKKGHLVYTPSRKIDGKTITSHDDNFALRLAVETDGIVVTNDNFRDHYKEKPEWRDVILNRLLMYSFVGNFFMPPEDPMGPAGPNLDQFLRKDAEFNHLNPIDKEIRKECQQRGKERPMSGSPKTDRNRFPDDKKNRQPGAPGHSSSATWTPPQTPQQAWQQQQFSMGQWQHVQKPGKRTNGNTAVRASPQSGGANLTWQQQNLMHEKSRQQQQQPSQVRPLMKKATNNTGPPVRSQEQTVELFEKLQEIFPEEIIKIRRILDNHSRETDLEKLSLYLLDIMDKDN